MPEIVITAELPDGSFQPCFSPSAVVRKYFRAGQELPAAEFLRVSRIALTEAAERVRERVGISRAGTYNSLPEIERWASALPPETVLVIAHISGGEVTRTDDVAV